MARRNYRRKDDAAERPSVGGGIRQVVEFPDGEWVVQRVTGSASTKRYRCPGCDHEIMPATPHVVAWPFDIGATDDARLQERRHWHTPCWNARGRRGPKR